LKDVFSKFPLPQDPNTDQLVINGRNQFNYRQEIVRIDHTVNQKLSVLGRFINDSIPTINPAGLFGQANFPGYATTNTNSPGKNLLVRATYVPSPNLLNEVGYAWSYGAIIANPIGLNTFSASPDVVSAITLPFAVTLKRIPNLNFVNGNNAGLFGFAPYRDINRNHNILDNLTWIRGHHTLKFGFSYHRYQKNENDAGGNPSQRAARTLSRCPCAKTRTSPSVARTRAMTRSARTATWPIVSPPGHGPVQIVQPG
jgi:hypothetical protein